MQPLWWQIIFSTLLAFLGGIGFIERIKAINTFRSSNGK